MPVYYLVRLVPKDNEKRGVQWRMPPPNQMPLLHQTPLFTSTAQFEQVQRTLASEAIETVPAKDAPVDWNSGTVYRVGVKHLSYFVLQPVDWYDVVQLAEYAQSGRYYHITADIDEVVELLQQHYGEQLDDLRAGCNDPGEEATVDEFLDAVRTYRTYRRADRV